MRKTVYSKRSAVPGYAKRKQDGEPLQTSAQTAYFNKPQEVRIRQLLGRRLKALRQKRGLSQEAFGLMTGMHRSWVGEIERGETNATVTTLRFLAECHNTTVSKLFKGIG